jgi:opacity protein-like surface antigen
MEGKIKMKKFIVMFLATLILVASSLAQSAEQETAESQVESTLSVHEGSADTPVQSALSSPKPWLWRFHINIYGWLPQAPADIDVGRLDIGLPENLSTIIDDLKLGAMLEFEVHKGPIGIFFSPIFYKGDESDHFKGKLGERRKFGLKETVFLIDYGISYDFGPWPLSKKPNSYKNVIFQPYAGFRFLHDNIKINVSPGEIDPGLSVRKKLKFNTPIIGVNTIWNLSRRWFLRVGGDVGGWKVDHVQSTYQAVGTVAYRFKTWDVSSKVFAGYRYMYIDYDKKNEALKVSIKGPLIGVGVEF